MSKSPDMEETLEEFTQNVWGRSRNDNICVTCGAEDVGKPEYFKDDISWEEWKISRMCQRCQDKIWGSDSE